MFAFITPSGPDMIILLLLGVLLFGRKLPEVGRYLGKGIIEFKKGISGLEDHVESSVAKQEIAPEPVRPPQRLTPAAPKFEETPSTPKA